MKQHKKFKNTLLTGIRKYGLHYTQDINKSNITKLLTVKKQHTSNIIS